MLHRAVPVAVAMAVGMAGLAAAMGIGRFAFTPLLPLMQQAYATTLAQGAWLAGANYLGYLAGALACIAFAPSSARAARGGLAAVAVSTLAMGLTEHAVAWLAWRFVAGVASAFVLVGASAWAMAHLAARQRSDGAGWVFAGVGSGIVFAGVVGWAAALSGVAPAPTWLVLGVAAALVAVATWPAFGVAPPLPQAAAAASPSRLDASAWTLVVGYGVFGLGYIIPATFIPAVARSLVPDPAWFGAAWPLFGLAAAVSTVFVSRALPRTPPRALAAASLWVMAVGVLAPALHLSLATVLVSALCVGGTFMVVTMAGLQEARRLAGTASATRLIAGMTAAFALGQLVGPLLVGAAAEVRSAIALPSIVAAALLAASALALRWRPAPR